MSRRRIALIAAVSAVTSLIVGTVGASCFWLSFNAQFISAGLLARHEADIVTGVAVLEHLRAGQVEDATPLLETLLDGHFIGAAALVREGNKINLNARRAVEKERLGRTVSGYEPTDESVRAAVQDAFRLLTEGPD